MKTEVIKCTDDNIQEIVAEQIKLLGDTADLNHLDVSQVTSIRWLFDESTFNGDISNWDVSRVINMQGLFEAAKFNGDISNWDVSSVTNMKHLFSYSEFNGDISNWDVSSVGNIEKMFQYSKFSGDISAWRGQYWGQDEDKDEDAVSPEQGNVLKTHEESGSNVPNSPPQLTSIVIVALVTMALISLPAALLLFILGGLSIGGFSIGKASLVLILFLWAKILLDSNESIKVKSGKFFNYSSGVLLAYFALEFFEIQPLFS